MSKNVLRTNLFRFDPAVLPSVWQFEANERYRAAWSLLRDELHKAKSYYLPTAGLTEMLSVISRGPVWVNANPEGDHAVPAIVTLYPVAAATVNQAIRLWAMDVLHMAKSSCMDIAEGFAVGEGIPLRPVELLQPGRRIPDLSYAVVPWTVSAAMSCTPMESSMPLLLKVTSRGGLIAWDDPVVAEWKQRRAVALHCIQPKLVLLRGEAMPFIALRVNLSHLLTQWRHKTRHAWLAVNGAIANLAIHTTYSERGEFVTQYSTSAARLLAHMGIDGFPALGVGELAATGALRPVHAHLPSTPLIANGTGPLFLDQACWHLTKTIHGAGPVLADRVVNILRKSTVTAAGAPTSIGPVMALTAHSRTAVRLEASSRTLSNAAYASFKGGRLPPLSLDHVSPTAADRMLCQQSTPELTDWFEREVAPRVQESGARTAVVETSMDVARGKADRDPKFQLRSLFARKGVTTQFIFDAEPGETDYMANASIIEVVRQSGSMPAPMIRVKSLPETCTVISVYLDRVKVKGPAAYLPVITRVTIEGGTPELFWFDSGANAPRWFDYRTGIARVHAWGTLLDAEAVRKLVSQALIAPTASAGTPLIVYLHSGLRTIYSALRDGGGEELPSIGNDGAWIVRIRADEDTAQISGDCGKHPTSPGFVGQRIGLYRPRSGNALYYFVSPSNQYGRVISQRHNTRFDVIDRSLRDPWQQLGVTEIALIKRGSFGSDDDIAHQSALLCRNAPMWDGNLRLPAPMHMGKQVAQDHPLVEIHRRVHKE